VVNIAFFMIFAVLDPSPLTVCINCSFLNIYIKRCLHLMPADGISVDHRSIFLCISIVRRV